MLQTSGAMQTQDVPCRRRIVVAAKEPDLDTGAYEVPLDIAAELERLGEQILEVADRLGLDV